MNFKPTVNRSLDRMNALQRVAESFRYVALVIEWWMSPEGKLRRWVKINVKLAAFIAAPTFLAFPVVTVASWELSSCVNALTAISGKLNVLPVLVLISIMVFFKIISVFIKR